MNMPDQSDNFQRTSVICITGGIGAGKSVVSRILRLRGFRVYDCDSEARRLMEGDADLRRELCRVAGSDIYRSDGSLDRSLMAGRIFSCDETRMRVNALVHRAVRDDIVRMASYSSDETQTGSVLFVETAIPCTAGIDLMSSRIWLVAAPEELRLARACGRDASGPGQIRRRMAAQKSEFEALPPDRTTVIVNDGLTPLLPQIDNSLKHIKD